MKGVINIMYYYSCPFCSEGNDRASHGLLESSEFQLGSPARMFGLLGSSSAEKWEERKPASWVVFQSANLGMRLLHSALKVCVSCNTHGFVRYLKQPFITVLQQRPARQFCLNTVQNKGNQKALFHIQKQVKHTDVTKNNMGTTLLDQSKVWSRIFDLSLI